METKKYKKLYLFINIPVVLMFFILFITPFFIISKITYVYYIGIVFRIIIGIWCIFNGIWNGCTDYYSFLKTNRFRKINNAPKWAWLVLLVVGVGCLITAFMGYGFNGVTKPM